MSNFNLPQPIECQLKFRRFMPFEDTAILVRQPDTKQDIYQVLFEDAYSNFNAELMTQQEIKDKYKIEV